MLEYQWNSKTEKRLGEHGIFVTSISCKLTNLGIRLIEKQSHE